MESLDPSLKEEENSIILNTNDTKVEGSTNERPFGIDCSKGQELLQRPALSPVFRRYEDQMRRIKDLEAAVQSRVHRTRRRVAALVEQHYAVASSISKQGMQRSIPGMPGQPPMYGGGMPYNPTLATTSSSVAPSSSFSFRNSHARLWLSHSIVKPTQAAPTPEVATNAAKPMVFPTFQLLIEGTLLMGVADHDSSDQFDQSLKRKPPQKPASSASATPEEEDVAVNKPLFTHLFDEVSVDFQTVYEPRPVEDKKESDTQPTEDQGDTPPRKKKRLAASGSITKKKRESGEGAPSISAADDYRQCILSAVQTMTWRKNQTKDSNGWQFLYTPPAPPPPTSLNASSLRLWTTQGWRVRTVVAVVKLRPQLSPDQYRIKHPRLSQAIFPRHGVPPPKPPSVPVGLPIEVGKKRKGSANEPSLTLDGQPFPPSEAAVDYPETSTLSLKQIMNGLFHYVREKQLMARDDDVLPLHPVPTGNPQVDSRRLPAEQHRSMILCDDVLNQALQMTEAQGGRIPFSQLQRSLLQSQAIEKVSSTDMAPVQATYVMKAVHDLDTGSNAPEVPWQLDLEVVVPNLLPYRLRSLLRRLYYRQHEYLTARSRARHSLMQSGAKGALRHLDEANKPTSTNQYHQYQQQQFGNVSESDEFLRSFLLDADKDVEPVIWDTLAAGAPPQSEARAVALLQAETALLREKDTRRGTRKSASLASSLTAAVATELKAAFDQRSEY